MDEEEEIKDDALLDDDMVEPPEGIMDFGDDNEDDNYDRDH